MYNKKIVNEKSKETNFDTHKCIKKIHKLNELQSISISHYLINKIIEQRFINF